MRRSLPRLATVVVVASMLACSGDPGAGAPAAPDDDAGDAGGGAPAADLPTSSDPGTPSQAGGDDAGADGAAISADAGPACKKHLTVVYTVGTGASAVSSHSNGCWVGVDADGAANHQFRKCSTSNYMVQNATAPNYAFDDTNPTASLSAQQNFLSQCSSGATGDGYEYMAYRGGAWRLLTATHIRAYFAELYSSDAAIADDYGNWQTAINGHTVSPMINFGPKDPTTIKSYAAKMCARVPDHGYFGAYNSDWPSGMTATDTRAVALAAAINACTALAP